MVEAQQRLLDEFGEQRLVDIASDANAHAAHRRASRYREPWVWAHPVGPAAPPVTGISGTVKETAETAGATSLIYASAKHKS
jgi:hypothetical protein